MTDPALPSETAMKVAAGMPRRNRAEVRFRLYGLSAVSIALAFLAVMLVTIGWSSFPAFQRTEITLAVPLDSAALGVAPDADRTALMAADYQGAVKRVLRSMFPEVRKRRDRRELYGLVSPGAGFALRSRVLADPSLIGTTVHISVPASDDVDMAVKRSIGTGTPATERRVSDRQLGWIDALRADGRLRTRFNTAFFVNADSREPELAGVLGAVVGSFLSLSVCLLLSFPIGVLAAIYLEEFAPSNRFTDLIEVNINNLAAVPSIVFGLLGLAVFLGWVGLPRSAPLVGGMVLSLMTLPTIIIAARAALKSVPPSIRDAALAIGASPMQAVFHHVAPLAMPGVLTGTIVGMAQALGETAPLLMIGMVAFIADVPGGITDPATALPVQVFLWADSPERAFAEKTAAAIMVLLAFLVCMNLTAVWLRKHFEHRY